MELPAVVPSNAWTMPQERYSAVWLRENGLGLVVGSFRHIAAAVDQLLEPATLARFRTAAAQLSNRAVFEIPDLLAGLVENPKRR